MSEIKIEKDERGHVIRTFENATHFAWRDLSAPPIVKNCYFIIKGYDSKVGSSREVKSACSMSQPDLPF
jgi:hypothetical protein